MFCSRAGFSLLDRCPPPGSGGPDGICTHSLPADNGLLPWFELRVQMVGSAGNAPVVASGLFGDTRVTAGPPGHFPEGGSGGGGRTHEGRAYEAHLNLILPAMKVVESAGNAPAWACLQGRCIACLPRPHVKSEVRIPKFETSSKLEVRITGRHGLTAPAPRRAVKHAYRFGFRDWDFGIPSNFGFRTSDSELAGRLGAAPSGLGFGDPAAHAGARPGAGAAAGNRTRTCSVAGSHSAVKSQPRKIEGPGAASAFCILHFALAPLPAHAISTKIKHLLVISRSQPAVSRRLFRCLRAHLLRSPSTVNPRQTHGTCLVATGGHTPPAENLGSPTSQSVLASRTSARCRVLSHSPSRSFRRSVSVSVVHRENKKPCSPSASRVGKSWSSRDALYLLTFRDLAGGYVPGPDRH